MSERLRRLEIHWALPAGVRIPSLSTLFIGHYSHECTMFSALKPVSSSVVEHQSRKLKVQGSIPVQALSLECKIFACASRQTSIGQADMQKGLWRNGSASDSRSEGWVGSLNLSGLTL